MADTYQSYHFVMPRGYEVLDRESNIEINSADNRVFIIVIPPYTRYGDTLRFIAGPQDFLIKNTFICRGQ